MSNLGGLSPYDDDGNLQVVVESPRASAIKFEFDMELGVFGVSRELPLGITYPFDWGFVPGTRGDDGDPLDALVLHSHATYPGVVLPCRILGMVEISQRDGRKKAIINNRIIATPHWHGAYSTLDEARDLPSPVREQIAQFFVSAVGFTGKVVTVKGWASAKRARRFIDGSRI